MSVYSKPVTFAILSVAVILVGTIITVIIPMMMPSTQPVSDYIKPYTAVELEGRDIYIREGCNNCHTQTVRPIRTEVARYGEYSKPEEFAYDRPFLWGSRRTGLDLNRVGGKYPDSWHYKHMNSPQSMFPRSNMPAYAWLARKELCTDCAFRKVSVLGYGYSEDEVRAQMNEYKARVTSQDYGSAAIRNEVTPEKLQGSLTEMDALVAYLQKLGRDVKEVQKMGSVPVAEASPTAAQAGNPFEGDKAAIEAGNKLFQTNCAVCHNADGKGHIGPDLTDEEWKYGENDSDIFSSISGGRPEGMPPFGPNIGEDDIWKVIAFIRSLGK
ncbi:MAG: cytochrome-c oxidase, cbb3-type subunit II [Nitrospirota bacterium]|nr:MAG: cytochrome-c oxidase, cbb3-type subunit II [Nitrospirota bacterium]